MHRFLNSGVNLEAFKARVLPASSVLIAGHDYPDPDCMAAAAAMAHLMKFLGARSCVTAFGGFVGREENRAMTRLLEFSVTPMSLVNWDHFDKVIVVDAVPGGSNLSLPPQVAVHAVFDHHRTMPGPEASYFWDIRQNIGASASLATMYLLAAQCPIPSKLATGLFYGIKTDTQDMGRDAFPEDIACYKLLFDLMDHGLLSQIEHPPRDRVFFETLHRAWASIRVYGAEEEIAHIHIGEVTAPDHVGEMADFFHALKTLEWTLCSGIFKDNFFFSIRCKHSDNAGQKAREIGRLCGGSGGGHAKIGAGRIPIPSRQGTDVLGGFKTSMKKVLEISGLTGKPLLHQ